MEFIEKLFFDMDGYSWAMELQESDNPSYHGKHRYGDVFKFSYDDRGRIGYYAVINPISSMRLEKYEYREDGFGVTLKVCKFFDPEDADWAADAVFSSKMHMVGTCGERDPESIIKYVAAMIRKYRNSGRKRGIPGSYTGIGIGFSEGDITYLLKQETTGKYISG